MGKVIAVTGKGGTGKTAVTAMLIRHLVKNSGKKYRMLVIDADADANLADALGVQRGKDHRRHERVHAAIPVHNFTGYG